MTGIHEQHINKVTHEVNALEMVLCEAYLKLLYALENRPRWSAAPLLNASQHNAYTILIECEDLFSPNVFHLILILQGSFDIDWLSKCN